MAWWTGKIRSIPKSLPACPPEPSPATISPAWRSPPEKPRRSATGAAPRLASTNKQVVTVNKQQQMKTAAAIIIIATAFGVYGAAAQNSQTTAPKPAAAARGSNTGALAMRQAAEAKQYLFAFIYEQNDDATKAARKIFDAGVAKITPAPKSVAVDRSDPTEKEMIEQFKLEAAPMPLVLAIAPNGAVTTGLKAADLTEARLADAVVGPGIDRKSTRLNSSHA